MEVKPVHVNEESKKTVESMMAEVHRPRHPHTIRHIEKRLAYKGVLRLERHPADDLGGIGRPPPKSGHGGKFTWKGSEDMMDSELDSVPPAIDEKDPNYADDGEKPDETAEMVVGEVEWPWWQKLGKESPGSKFFRRFNPDHSVCYLIFSCCVMCRCDR